MKEEPRRFGRLTSLLGLDHDIEVDLNQEVVERKVEVAQQIVSDRNDPADLEVVIKRKKRK